MVTINTTDKRNRRAAGTPDVLAADKVRQLTDPNEWVSFDWFYAIVGEPRSTP